MEEKTTLLIEFILQDMGLSYENKKHSKAIACQNPVTHCIGGIDSHYSGYWYKRSGNMRSFNGDLINNSDFMTMKELCKFLGYENEYYKIMNEKIEDINVLYRRTNTVKKALESKSATTEVGIDFENYEKCVRYLQTRKIEPVEGLIEPTMLEFDGKYGKFKQPYIGFRYENGFTKYRNINNGNPKARFLSFGGEGYRDFFKVRVNNTKTCHLMEGEMCARSASYYLTDDVMATHNLMAIPKTDSLKGYNKVVCSVDNDKYWKICWGLYDNLKEICDEGTEIVIKPKLMIYYKDAYDFEHVNSLGDKQGRDYNDLHIASKLDKVTIETSLLSKSDISGDIESFEFLR